LVIILVIALAAAFAPLLTANDPSRSGMEFLAPPDATHWFGTDDLGRDVFARVLYGGRASLIIGIGSSVIATLIGVPVGLVSGYAGGRTDVIAEQLINLFIALPGMVIALMFTAIVGPTLTNLTLVLGVVSWPRMARLVRGQALLLREAVFVDAARAAGGGPSWILRMHLLPNTMRIIAAQFSLTVAYSIFTAASLSFLGLGVPPPMPDWGGMVREGFNYLELNPSMSIAPSVAVALTVLGFYCVGSET